MKIVKAEVFVTCPGRNFVTLKITTEDGITGLGDAPDCRFCFAVSGTYWLTRSFRFVTSLHGCGAAL